jgi:hypothetical protein
MCALAGLRSAEGRGLVFNCVTDGVRRILRMQPLNRTRRMSSDVPTREMQGNAGTPAHGLIALVSYCV